MVIRSAIKTKEGKIYVGRRHHNIINENIGVDFKNGIQGFIDDNENFLNRKDAYVHAIDCGQLKEDENLIGSVLTSEDLW